MIKGIGTDILKINKIEDYIDKLDDPFIRYTYTTKEIQLIQTREVPKNTLATRFAGKEAVFKALSTSSDSIKHLSDIEILEDNNGAPIVTLYGAAKRIAHEHMITKVLLSLSYDDEYAIAYAIALQDA